MLIYDSVVYMIETDTFKQMLTTWFHGQWHIGANRENHIESRVTIFHRMLALNI